MAAPMQFTDKLLEYARRRYENGDPTTYSFNVTKGARLPLTLHFENAGSLDVDLQVQAPGIVGSQTLLAENNGAG